MSTISTSLGSLPSCHTSCSKLSSKINHWPSVQDCFPSATLSHVCSSSAARARCARSRQFVGPQWGQMCVPGSNTLNFTWPRVHDRASVNCSIRRHVAGVFPQFPSIFCPRVNNTSCFQSPTCSNCSLSPSKCPSSVSTINASSLITFQWACKLASCFPTPVSSAVQNGLD